MPEADWEFAEWKRARVNLDYHIEVDGFFYSVPHALIHAEVDVRVTARMIEIFHRGQRVGVHECRYLGRRHGTNPDHMPSSHRRYAEWTPDRFRRWAASIGPSTEADHRGSRESPHPEQGFRTCLGILKLYRGIDAHRAEAVSARASKSAGSPARASPPSSPESTPNPSRRTAVNPRCSITSIYAAPAITIERNPMLAHPTLEQLHALGLHGLAKGFKELESKAEARGLEHAEWLGLLLEYETTLRRQKRFERAPEPPSCVIGLHRGCRSSQRARARPRLVPEARRLRLDRRAPQLAHHRSERAGEELACLRVGQKACRQDMSVLYYRVPRLFTELAITHGDGAMPGCCARSARQAAESSTIGGRRAHPDQARATCSKSSRIAMTLARS